MYDPWTERILYMNLLDFNSQHGSFQYLERISEQQFFFLA